MNKIVLGFGLMGLLTIGMSTVTQATLIDRGNGMIYDSDQDLTWLQDANYMLTSVVSNEEWYGPSFDGGEMSWWDAYGWVESLTYGGYDDWRLPTMKDPNMTYDNWGIGRTTITLSDSGYEGTKYGYNVDPSTSELAYMFHVNLGNESAFNPDRSRNEDGCPEPIGCVLNTSADGVDILNLQSGIYWMGTEAISFLPNADGSEAWRFATSDGYQYARDKILNGFAWAVRDGDVAVTSVPEPGTLVLMLAGLAGIGVASPRRR